MAAAFHESAALSGNIARHENNGGKQSTLARPETFE
jgi:hypothetical protein